MNKNEGAIFTLDLGTTTGWAMGTSSCTRSGTKTFCYSRFEGGGMRYLRFRQWLESQRQTEKLRAVYFEAVRRHKGVDAAHAYGGFLSTLTGWCEEHHLPYAGVPVQTIKKFISGYGNASKDKVMSAVRARGFFPQDDNEADAVALLCWVREQLSS